jgi:two-component system NarL family sensor kinase
MGSEENGIYFTFIAGLSILAVFLVAYAISIARNLKRRHLRYREFALRDAQVIESERKRISEELHDDLGSSLATLKLGLQSIQEQYPGIELIDRTILHLEESSDKLRSISNNLLPKNVEVRGLAGGIAILIDELNACGKIKFQFVSDIDDSAFDKSTSIIVYRLIQEMLTNTIKHAFASMVKISLIDSGNKLLLQYADNGKGFTVDRIEKPETKNGLRNISSRLEILGAVYELHTAPGEGVHYKISIPLKSMKYQNG